MSDTDRRLTLGLGQSVRLAANPSHKPGYVVAVMPTAPYEALVRWTDTEATFEALEISSNLRPECLSVSGDPDGIWWRQLEEA